MVKIKLLVLFACFPFFCQAQIFGLGGQYSENSDGQFFISGSFPSYKGENFLNMYISSGFEYTTSGGAKLAGLNVKPIQATSYISESLYNDYPVTLLIGIDAGYLFDARKGRKNSIIITPNLYIDYKVFFIKAGYDIDTFHGQNQFFVRAGVGLGLGTFKMLARTSIR